jgi:AAA+ superfamily predicted ATPase
MPDAASVKEARAARLEQMRRGVDMDMELACREAVALGEAVWPILGFLPEDRRKEFQDAMTADLATIATLIGSATDGFSAEEKMATATVVFAIGSHAYVDTCRNVADRWRHLPAAQQQEVLSSLQSAAGSLVPFFERVEAAAPRSLHLAELRQGGEVTALDAPAHAYYRFAQFVAKSDGTVSPAEETALKEVWQMIYAPAQAKPSERKAVIAQEAAPTLEDVLSQLDALVGMDNVKASVKTLVNFLKVQSERRARNLLQTPISLHAVFRGPPGTGKTTVARLMGKVYKSMGFLKSGHLIETDRAGLVAGYVGQTSSKVDKLVNDALDGVLFIDEAYALMPEDSSNDFGREAIDILLKRTEDYRDRLVVIVAGYTEEMNRFLEANPGVRSRFNRYFDFNDYAPSELVEIFRRFCRGGNFVLAQGVEDKLVEIFKVLYSARDRTFGNGRLVRNLFEKAVERQADRIASLVPLTDALLSTLEIADIPPGELQAGKSSPLS